MVEVGGVYGGGVWGGVASFLFLCTESKSHSFSSYSATQTLYNVNYRGMVMTCFLLSLANSSKTEDTNCHSSIFFFFFPSCTLGVILAGWLV